VEVDAKMETVGGQGPPTHWPVPLWAAAVVIRVQCRPHTLLLTPTAGGRREDVRLLAAAPLPSGDYLVTHSLPLGRYTNVALRVRCPHAHMPTRTLSHTPLHMHIAPARLRTLT
jgi:hypothetical protein